MDKVQAKRTPEQRLAHLDFKLGKGVGAVKERKKLLARIEAARAETKRERREPHGHTNKTA
jgi:hypothetical protein